MKRTATTLLVLLVASVASAVLTSPVAAALRVPQVAVLGGSLQGYLNSVGESINVLTDQDATQTWSHTVSNTSTFTVMFQGSPNPNVQQFGLYNGSAVVPTIFPLIGGFVGPQGFSTATFKPGNVMTVNYFDANGGYLGQSTFNGVDPTNFGFSLTTACGTVYTQDARNAGGAARAIVFRGTGANTGTWWLCFDEECAPPTDQDFDDLVINMESVNPTPVSKTNWGSLKARFR